MPVEEQAPETSTRTNVSARIRKHRLLAGVAGAGLILLLLLAAYIAILLPATPPIGDLQRARYHQPSVMLSADGRRLGSFRERFHEWVELEQVSPHLLNALLATEDHRFYDHQGIDVTRIIGAAFYTISGDLQGASTITQQLARNLFPEKIGRSRTLTRKLKEVLTALRIEDAYSKEQILETYLNTVPFLYRATGIEMAARTYFSKPAAQLDINESAILVAMLKGTHYYNPVVNPERALKRRNLVLTQMARHGHITPDEVDRLQRQPLQLRFQRLQEEVDHSAPHFTLHARRWLKDWAAQNDIDLSTAGLVVETTIDLRLQEMAERAVTRQTEALQQIADVEWSRPDVRLIGSSPEAYDKLHKRTEPFAHFWSVNQALLDRFIEETPEFKKAVADGRQPGAALADLRADDAFMTRLKAAKTRLEAGFVAIDPTSGEIKAWIGSRDFKQDQFDHVAQAERQPGSTFKPMVYGAALEQGLSPFRLYQDRQVEIRAPDGSLWRPTDMGGPSLRQMTLRDGLIYSKNSVTAQVMQEVGLSSIINLAQAMGVNRSRLEAVPSLVLGTSPVTLLEMVSAYATIASAGEYRKPVFIRRIIDRHGETLAELSSAPQRAMTEETAIELIDMMRGVVNQGTARTMKARFSLSADIAGKTGTTQNNTDGWFMLMQPRLVAGAWVGFNDARVTMRSDYWGQGGHNAALLVGDFFHGVLKEDLIDRRARFARPTRAMLIADGSGIAAGGASVAEDEEPAAVELDGIDENAFTRTMNEIGRILTGNRRQPDSPPPEPESRPEPDRNQDIRDPWKDIPNSTR
jgi:penicillin-binding protein 1A